MWALLKGFRILTLLAIFIFVAFYAKTQKLKSRSWSEPLPIIIFPINADASPSVEDYIKQLERSDFSEIDRFFLTEAKHYGLTLQQPTTTELGITVSRLPPASPLPGAGYAEILWWGVKLRYWAFWNTPDDQSNHHRARVFLLFHETGDNKRIPNSHGLNKGLLATVHAFASKDRQPQNNIIIAHEILHTVGAIDKYNANNQPVFPAGYAEPEQTPLYPQRLAEIMAGKIPLTDNRSIMASSLEQCIIGEKTAEEINWLQVKTQE